MPLGPEDSIRVDVGVLKTQILTLSALCNKMDQVIEKLVDQHDRHIRKVYEDMEKREKENDNEIRDIHNRIDTVLDKLQSSEKTILTEMQELRKDMQEQRYKERAAKQKLDQWKWFLYGGILFCGWLLSHVKLDTILHAFN